MASRSASSSMTKKVLVTLLVLIVFGHVMLFSATGVMGLQRFEDEFYYLTRQAISTGVGLSLMVLISRVRYQHWAVASSWLIWIQFILVALTLFSPLAHHAQGASRWLRMGAFSFQPSELAKITVPIYMARLLANNPGWLWKWWALRLLPLVLLLGTILKQPDLGTTALLLGVILGMLFLSGVKLRYIVGLIASGIIFVVASMLLRDYRRRRLLAFLDPWSDPYGSGFQTIQSFISFQSGGIFGVGLGNGNSKLFYLPEVHTDFIFSLIGEELGFVGAMATVLAFGYLIYSLIRASMYAPDNTGRLMGFGLTLAIALQVVVNLGGVTGLLPLKGLPLPFLSWGRSALIGNLISMGVLWNLVRQADQGLARSPVSPR